MRILLFVVLLLSSQSVFCQSAITFEHDSMNVGTVIIPLDSAGKENTSTYTNVDFAFKNTGNEPLVISSAISSGSALVDFPKDPIIPGRSAKLTVKVYRYRYSKPMSPDGTHPFCTWVILQGNFKGEKKIAVVGSTKKVRK